MFKPHHKMYAIGFLIDFGVMAIVVALPFFVFRMLGGGAPMSGAFGAAQGAAYAALCLASAGFVSRAKNGLSWAVVGLSLSTVFTCALPFFRNPYLCGALSTLGIGALALVWPALHSYVGGEPDPEIRGRRMSHFNLSWSLGFALSPLVTGPMFELDYRLPFLLVLFINIIVLLLIRSLPHEHEHHARASAEVLEASAESDRASERYLYAAWCATLMGNFLAAVARSVFPRRVEDLVASGELRFFFEDAGSAILRSGAAVKFSWLAFTLSLVAAMAFWTMGKTGGWRHRSGILFFIQAAAGVAFYVLGSTRSLAVMVVCFMFIGLNNGFTFFSSVYYSVANWQHKHRRAAINEGAVGVGGFVGSLLFGYLAGRYGLEMPFHLTPLIMLGAIALQAVLIRARV